MNLTDDFTRNLYNGMTLILKIYPDSKIEIGCDQNISIEISNQLDPQNLLLLESWNWIYEKSAINGRSWWSYYTYND